MSYEVVFSGFLCLFSAVAMVMAFSFPGPAAHVPVIALGVLLAVSLITLGKALRRGAPADGDRFDLLADFNLKVLFTFLFFLSFKYVSFRLTAPLFIVAACRMCGVSWRAALFSSAAATLVTWAVFIKWLQVYIEL